jgi:uncharacterized MAPEG superfamily protein
VALGILQVVLGASLSTPRDAAVPPLTGVAGRVDRALRNLLETFPFFAAAALAVVFTQCTSGNNASVGGGVIADGRSGAVCSVGAR